MTSRREKTEAANLSLVTLSRRERQIMEAVYLLGEAGVAQVRENLPDPPSYSAVRALLGILVDKGHLTFRRSGLRYVYRPTHPRGKAARTALQRLVNTFYDGSPVNAAAALLELSAGELTPQEIERLSNLIEKARTEGR